MVMLLTLTLIAQVPTPIPAPPPVPVPLGMPDYAIPVREEAPAIIPEDPVLGCIHRPAEVPYDKATLETASRRILQELAFSRLREARRIESLGPPSEPSRSLVPPRPISPRERLRHRALHRAIDQHWELFEARIAEVRLFVHRPEEVRIAARRAAGAWDALLSLISQNRESLPPDLQDELNRLDAWVGVLRGA